MQRIAYFDQMKGVAIILVVVGHVMLFMFGLDGSDLVNWLSIFHMPVFFYISGYFAYRSINSAKPVIKQLWQKIHAILVPFLVWCVIWNVTHNDESLGHMLMRCGGKYWFLNTLAALSLFFIVYERLAGKVKNVFLYIGLWCIPFIVLVFIKLIFGGATSYVSVDSLVTHYRYYLMGFLCSKYEWLNKILFHNRIVYALAVVSFALEFFFMGLENYFLAFAGSVGAIIILQNLFMSVPDSHNLKWLSYIGTKTLPIYLIHYFFIPDLIFFSDLLGSMGNPFVVHLLLSLIVTALIIAVCLVVERVISGNDYLSWVLCGKSF